MGVLADDLFERLEAGSLSPKWRQDPLTRDLAKWIAFHEGERAVLAGLADWKDGKRKYRVDHLPARASGAYADFLFGADPTFTPVKDSDQALLDAIVNGNDLDQALWDAVDHMSAEGEWYWRIYVDKGEADVPIIDWHSRSMTVPLFHGRNLVAVAFVSEVNVEDPDAIWRYVEVHEPGEVHNRLYRENRPKSEATDAQQVQTLTGIGQEVDLEQSPDTAYLEPHWAHGLPMLAGRLPNRLGRDKRMGLSDYVKAEDLFLDLNEAHTIDAENFRLAGKKRAVMPERFAKKDGTAETDRDVYFAKEGWEDEMAEGNDGPFKILEYSYEGEASISRKQDLENTALTRMGLVKQFVSPEQKEGGDASGTALKVRLIPTTLAGRGKSRRVDRAVPYQLSLAAMVDQLPQEQGGFGRSWADAEEPPKMERGTILPEEEAETYTRVSNAVAQGVMSLQQAVEELHPKWDPKQVKDEVDRIREDQQPPPLDTPGVDPVTGEPLPPGGGA